MEPDAFNFTGAGDVTALDIHGNAFRTLPEELLWSMPALLIFDAAPNTKLETLPERFFSNQSHLLNMTFTSSTNFGAQKQLPDGLFKGLSNLTVIWMESCRYQNLPNLDDLTVCCEPFGVAGRLSQSPTRTRVSSCDEVQMAGHGDGTAEACVQTGPDTALLAVDVDI